MSEILPECQPPVSRARVFLSQVIACMALNFLLIGLGMSVNFVTMVLPEVMNAKDGISLTTAQASWFGSLGFLCQPLGSIFSGPILDYFGRKKAFIVVSIPHLFAWLLMYYAWDVPSLFIGNALLGIGTGIMEAPSITYVGEISDCEIRGVLTILTNAFTSFGMFAAYLLGTVMPWRQAALISLCVPLTTMLLVLFVPETPIWLLSKGRQKEALTSLCTLRGWCKPQDVNQEFEELCEYNEIVQQCPICLIECSTNPKTCQHINANIVQKTFNKFKYVFFVKETMRPFYLVIAYFFFHSMSGLAPVKPNMVNICEAFGMKYDSKLIVVIAGVVFIALNIVSAIIVKVIGKRKLILGSLLAMAGCSLSLSLYAGTSLPTNVFSYEVQTFPDEKSILPVILFILLVSFHGLGIPWILLSEVFPFRSRGMATGLAAAVNYVIYFVAAKTNYNIEASLHLTGTFALYAGFGVLGTIYLYFYLPETESKTLAEIEACFQGKQRIFANDCIYNSLKNKLQRSKDEATEVPMLGVAT